MQSPPVIAEGIDEQGVYVLSREERPSIAYLGSPWSLDPSLIHHERINVTTSIDLCEGRGSENYIRGYRLFAYRPVTPSSNSN